MELKSQIMEINNLQKIIIYLINQKALSYLMMKDKHYL
jgi:hypothetical protein